MRSSLSGPLGRRAGAALAAFLVALAAAVGWRELGPRRALAGLPTGAAEWIWAPLGRTVEPLAFYAARDFDLAAVPAAARLLAAADEEYVLYLNGRRVGSGGTPAGERPVLDAYEVAPLLRRGGNRLVAELRSGRGAGGFLARLADGAGRTLAATDAGWRIVRRHRPGLVRGWLPLAGAAAAEREAAASWSRPPVGRWGMPRRVAERPLFADGRPVVAAELPAVLVRREHGVGIDLGREVEGYLALEVAPRTRRQVGLLYVGAPAPDLQPVAVVVAPGAPLWLDVRPRRLRALSLTGCLEVTGVRVYPASPSPEPPEPPLGEDLGPKGLLGLSPPPRATPVEDAVRREVLGAAVEDEVRRELERLPGVARRKDL